MLEIEAIEEAFTRGKQDGWDAERLPTSSPYRMFSNEDYWWRRGFESTARLMRAFEAERRVSAADVEIDRLRSHVMELGKKRPKAHGVYHEEPAKPV